MSTLSGSLPQRLTDEYQIVTPSFHPVSYYRSPCLICMDFYPANVLFSEIKEIKAIRHKSISKGLIMHKRSH